MQIRISTVELRQQFKRLKKNILITFQKRNRRQQSYLILNFNHLLVYNMVKIAGTTISLKNTRSIYFFRICRSENVKICIYCR
jgi:hypothetical protein